jgi:hypothetical protein
MVLLVVVLRFIQFLRKVFNRVNHGLLLGTLTRKFRSSMIFCMSSNLTGRTQRVRVGDYLSETIYCHSGVPQGSHFGSLFFILTTCRTFLKMLGFSMMLLT